MKHKLTRITALALAVIMSFSMLLVPVQAASFTDVPEKAWYKAAVDYVSEKGWMNGVGEMTFAPTMDVTRAMFVTLLAAYADETVDNSSAAFTDTGAGKWYTGSAAWAAGLEIVKGIGDGRFAPNRAITRQDLCVMLYKYLHVAGIELKADADRTYADFAGVSAYAKEAVAFCAASGLVTGFEDGTFRPKNTATRAQVAQILMRLDQLRQGQELPEDPMPAQSFDGAAGEDMSVSVNAPQGALPENTNMTVSRVTDEARLAAIEAKAGTKVYAAADISFSKDETEIEPSAEVEVQISLDGLENLKNPTVVHVKDDNSVEYVAAELISTNRSGSEKALRFYAKDFSVYAVISGGGDTLDSLTITFWARENGSTGEWKVINKQIVLKKQLLDESNEAPIFDPGVPNISTTQSFEGWYWSQSFTEETEGYSVEEINAAAKTGAASLSGNQEMNLYAMVYDVVYVIFHDQAGAVLRTDYHHVTEGESFATAMINMTYAPFKDNQNFTGWVTRKDVLTLGDNPTYAANPDPVIRNNTEYQVSETLELYPYLQEGYWLIFNPNIANNDSDPTKCEYKGPDFVPKGTLTAEPTFKSEHPRPGYDLEGWYTDPEMQNPFTFGQALTEDTTLYAKWTPIEADYLVVFMVQDATDSVNAATEKKHYSYYDSVRRSWRYNSGKVNTKSGDTVSVFTGNSSMNDTTLVTTDLTGDTYYSDDKTIAKLGQYFQYSTDKNAGNTVMVKGDGSSILYVYYDRKPVTFKLYEPVFTSASGSSIYNYTSRQYFYEDSNNNYVPLTFQDYSSSGYYSWYDNQVKFRYYYDYYSSYYGYWRVSTDGGSTFSTYSSVTLYYASSNTLLKQMTGLYNAPFEENDWPTLGEGQGWYYNDYGTHQAYSSSNYRAPGTYSGDPFEVMMYRAGTMSSTKEKTIYHITQNAETGAWGEAWYDGTIDDAYVYLYSDSTGHVIDGFNVSTDVMSTSSSYYHTRPSDGIVRIHYENDGTINSMPYYGIQGSAAYIYYHLTENNLVFRSVTGIVKEETLRYGQSMERFAHVDNDKSKDLFVPTDGPEGYYFEGWYTDESYLEPFNFKDSYMPDYPVNVYAKWTKTRYRVFLDYAGGDSAAQISFPDGTYSSTWRLDYGEQVDENRIANVTRDGWILMGWYLDPEFKHAFNFSMGANDDMIQNEEDYYYGIQKSGETDAEYTARMNGNTRKGTDPLSGSAWDDTWDTDWETHDYSGEYEAAGYESADKMREARGEQHNVVHVIRLYAKWRQDPKGTIGIRVNYLGDNLPSTGYFNTNGQPHTWLDPETYVDRADAYAQPASVPEIEGEQFLYWEILKPVLDSNGNYVYNDDLTIKMEPTGRRAYPGQTWQVHLEDAIEVRVPVPNPNCDHSSVSAVEARAATCTENGYEAHYVCNLCGKRFSDEAATTEIDPVIPATGHTWGEWQYRADGQGGHYHICSVCNAKAGGNHVMQETSYTAPTTTDEGSRTETCSICGYTKTTVIPMLQGYTISFSVPAGVTAPADQTGLLEGASVTLPTSLQNVPEGYTFQGWVEQTVDETTDVVTPLSSYTVSGDDTLYALFTRTESSGEKEYVLVSSAPADWSGNYVITYGTDSSMYLMKGVTPSSNGASIESTANTSTYAASGVTLSGTKLSGVADDYLFTFTPSGSYYTVKSVSTGAYLGEATSYDLAAYNTVNTTYCRWTPGYYSSNASSLYNANSSSSYPLLSFNTSNKYFWAGSTTNQATNAQNVRFWKENVIGTTYYTTSIVGGETPVDPSGDKTVTYVVNGASVGSSTVAAGTSVTVGQGVTVTAPSGMEFTGYWVTAQGSSIDFANVEKYAHGTASYEVNADTTFYAVLSSSLWTLTNFDDVTPGTYALLTPDYHAFNGTITSGHGQATTDSFVFTDGVASSAPSGVCELTFAATSYGFSMYNESNGYLYAKKASSGNLAWSSDSPSTSNFYLSWRSYSSNWAYYNNDAYLRTYNNASFRTYGNNANNGLQLALKSSGYTTGAEYNGNAVTEPVTTEKNAPVSQTRSGGFVKPLDATETTYRLATSVEPGKTYLIVYGSDATAAGSSTMYAMNSYSTGSDSGYLMLATPNFKDSAHNEITDVKDTTGTVSDCEWTVEEGSVSGTYKFYNLYEEDKYYLYQDSSSSGNLSADANPANTDYLNWSLTKAGEYFVFRNPYWEENDYWYDYCYLNYTSSGFTNASSFWDSPGSSARMYLYEKVVDTTPTYTLTINYLYADETQAHEPYVGEYKAGDDYSVTSPTIGGYTPNYPVVEGTMAAEPQTRTVYYTADVVEGNTWNIRFVDEDGEAMTDEGYPEYAVEDGAVLTRPEDPVREDYYFLGWYFVNDQGAEVLYDFSQEIHSDLTLIAHFLYAWEVEYMVQLRAVYGLFNDTGDTHVYWYANDGTNVGLGEGAGDRYESENDLGERHIPLNTPVSIPTPTTWKGVKNGESLYRQGYTFVGWARIPVPADSSGVIGQGYPDLTAESAELYLRWNGSQYEYLPSNDGITSEQLGGEDPNVWRVVDKIYADEGRPFHDMYAVWAPGDFYIFHSATGRLEAISYLAVTNSTSGRINLSKHVTPGYLYGGYYLDDPDTTKENRLSGYGYITAAEMSSIIKARETGAALANWSTAVANPTADEVVSAHVVAPAEIANSKYKTYDGTARYVGGGFNAYTDETGAIIRDNGALVLTAPIWNSAFAGTARGTRLKPEAGKVYYLKEVPSTYLSAKVLYTYDINTNEIQDVWTVTLVDDNNYRRVGFKTVDGQDAAGAEAVTVISAAETVAKSFTLRPATPSTGDTLPATKVTAENFGFKQAEAGYVAVTRRTDLVNGGKPNFTMLPGWITLDGVQVCDNGMNWHYVEGADPDKQLTWAHAFNGTEKLYIDMSEGGGVSDGWLGFDAVIKFMFFDEEGNNSGYVATRATGNGSIYEVTVPNGNWTKFLVKRMNPANPDSAEGEWSSTGNIPLNQDMTADQFQDGADIASNVNLIDWFTAEPSRNTHVHWGYYPAFPNPSEQNP